jgi:hypothetical protein
VSGKRDSRDSDPGKTTGWLRTPKLSPAAAAATVLSVFAASVLVLAFTGNFFGHKAPLTVAQLYERAAEFANTADDFEGEGGSKAITRALDYKLPDSARVFALHMLGEENRNNLGYYYLLTYYLFPRQVDISVGQPARFITGPPPERIGHYAGTPARSADELKALGYDLVVDITGTNASQQFLFVRPPPAAGPGKQSLHPYTADVIKAILLPLLVAVFGASVINALFPKLRGVMGAGETGACGLAIGILVTGQAAFGLRLVGVAAESLIWWLLLAWAGYMVARRIVLWSKHGWPDLRPWLHPAILGLIPLVILFFVLFRLSGQLSLMEFDALASWAFKSKIIHHSKGNALIEHFSNPAWAHAHFDYPPLVPSLYALTYGAIGRVNEFVTKFWPAWMLLFVIIGVLSACRWPRQNKVLGLALALGLAFMPFSLDYVLQEGATIPMFFFLTLGGLQMACAMIDNSRERLGLGILILAGAAMCKFEGAIVLALWLALLLVYRQTRLLLLPDCSFLGGLILILFVPYLILRFQIPVLTPESKWMKSLIENPLQVLANFPRAVFALLATQCVDGEFAKWASPDKTGVVWTGAWKGFESLLNETTLGFVWVGAFLSALLCRTRESRKPTLLFGGVFLLYTCALGVVLSALPETLDNTNALLNYCYKSTGGRFLSPAICAWVTGLAALVARSTLPASAPSAQLPTSSYPETCRVV